MLKSEKIEAGPLMSIGGATRRMFAVNPLWLRYGLMPWVWLLWVLTVSPLYYLGGWLFYRHGKQRRDLVDRERHHELLERNVVG